MVGAKVGVLGDNLQLNEEHSVEVQVSILCLKNEKDSCNFLDDLHVDLNLEIYVVILGYSCNLVLDRYM